MAHYFNLSIAVQGLNSYYHEFRSVYLLIFSSVWYYIMCDIIMDILIK